MSLIEKKQQETQQGLRENRLIGTRKGSREERIARFAETAVAF